MHTTEFTPALPRFFDGMIAAMQRAFRHYVNVHSRRDQIASLEALSDQQLAAMGLTRDRIVQHVFRDRLI